MTSIARRSTRSRSSLNVKFADDPDYDERAFEDEQGDDVDDDIDELPVARIKQEQQRHTSQTNTNSGIVKRRRGRPAKREPLHGDEGDDGDWHEEGAEEEDEEEDFVTIPPVDVTLSPSGPDGNASVYEFKYCRGTKVHSSSRRSISVCLAKLPTERRSAHRAQREITLHASPTKLRIKSVAMKNISVPTGNLSSLITILTVSSSSSNYCTGKKYLLQRHLKSHSTERPHKCNESLD